MFGLMFDYYHSVTGTPLHSCTLSLSLFLVSTFGLVSFTLFLSLLKKKTKKAVYLSLSVCVFDMMCVRDVCAWGG